MFFQELTDRLEGMKVAHQDEKQDYERQLAELRAEYTKTKDELDGEIMVKFNKLKMNFLYFFMEMRLKPIPFPNFIAKIYVAYPVWDCICIG